MDQYKIDDILVQQPETERDYTEFIQQESMSVGVYTLPEDSVDTQDPHTEDEIYYVISGSATLKAGDNKSVVEPGDVIFVEREVEHRFVDIEEKLTLLVVFAPARGTLDNNN